MKVINLSVTDMAGAAYTLSHALNKQKDVTSINLRAANNYINYPTIADVKFYTKELCQQMIYNADVVVFHTAVQPYYSAYQLDPEKLKSKRKLLYFHGTDCRYFGKEIIKQADRLMPNDYETLVSTPDLLEVMPTAQWLPVARSFHETKRNYGLCNQDEKALKELTQAEPKVTIAHATTNAERKGSEIFYKIITELIQSFPNLEYQVIQNMTWDNCLSALSHVNIYYDQALIGAYGLAAVEASIFKAATFCYITAPVMDMMEKESGLKNPFIQWSDEDALRSQSFILAQDSKVRKMFGQKAYNYCKVIHDEGPVARRFLKIVEAM